MSKDLKFENVTVDVLDSTLDDLKKVSSYTGLTINAIINAILFDYLTAGDNSKEIKWKVPEEPVKKTKRTKKND